MKTLFYVAAFLLIVAGAIAQNVNVTAPSTAPSNVAYQYETQAQTTNDVNVLQFALTLENLEAAFYRMGQSIFGVSDFLQAGYPASVYSYVDLIRVHEATHVSFLSQVLQSLNVVPVQACTYNFNSLGFFNNVSSYLAAAMLLENTGVMAYDGAAADITNAAYLTAAATITTTEARHAAFLNELNGVYAFGNYSFDIALNATTIYNMIAPIIASCPANNTQFSLPVVRSNFAYNYTAGTNYSSVYNTTGKRDFSQMGRLITRNYETPAAIQNDNNVLNYALHLEQFGRAFYTTAQQKFQLSDYIAAGYNVSVYNHMQLITLQEQTHTAFLQSVLQARNAPMIVQPCVYNLNASLASVNSFLNTARMVENLEVTAYDGGINALSDEGLVQAAATIATIEARHAAYLNYLLLNQPEQIAAFDSTNSPAQILNITAPFFVSCPQDPYSYLPQAPYYQFSTNVAPSVAPSPTTSPAVTVSVSTTYSSTYSYSYTGSYSNSYSYSGSYSNSYSYSQSPPPPPPRGQTTINFFFADMLAGINDNYKK